jgi:hypothetical protein
MRALSHGEIRSILTEKQGGKCALCGEARILVLDHDHMTGMCRAVVCRSCNHRIGFYEVRNEAVSLDSRRRIVDYLATAVTTYRYGTSHAKRHGNCLPTEPSDWKPLLRDGIDGNRLDRFTDQLLETW